jgi:hypothetical protein
MLKPVIVLAIANGLDAVQFMVSRIQHVDAERGTVLRHYVISELNDIIGMLNSGDSYQGQSTNQGSK